MPLTENQKSMIEKANLQKLRQKQTQEIQQRKKQFTALNTQKPALLQRQSLSLHKDLWASMVVSLYGIYCLVSIFLPGNQPTKKNKTSNIQTSIVKIINNGWFQAFVAIWLIWVGYKIFQESELKKYLDNLKGINLFPNNYQKARNTKVQLVFKIECYHMKQGQNGTKVVTNTIQKIVPLAECYDMSGCINQSHFQTLEKSYLFIDYDLNYEFIEKQDEQLMEKLYKHFVDKNKSDTYQTHCKFLRFTPKEALPKESYYLETTQSILPTLFFYLNIFCVSWPSAMILQLMVQRLKMKIQKKIKIANPYTIGVKNF